MQCAANQECVDTNLTSERCLFLGSPAVVGTQVFGVQANTRRKHLNGYPPSHTFWTLFRFLGVFA